MFGNNWIYIETTSSACGVSKSIYFSMICKYMREYIAIWLSMLCISLYCIHHWNSLFQLGETSDERSASRLLNTIMIRLIISAIESGLETSCHLPIEDGSDMLCHPRCWRQHKRQWHWFRLFYYEHKATLLQSVIMAYHMQCFIFIQ